MEKIKINRCVLLKDLCMVIAKFYSLVGRIIANERSAVKFAATVSLGIYIGVSPFAGFHTIMTFVFGWFFALNIPALFSVSMLIHNPWTTIPIYLLDHSFGKFIFTMFNLDAAAFDPAWVNSCNSFLLHHTGISGLSLTAFLVGGNVLAVGLSVLCYPIVKRAFELYLARKLLVIQ